VLTATELVTGGYNPSKQVFYSVQEQLDELNSFRFLTRPE